MTERTNATPRRHFLRSAGRLAAASALAGIAPPLVHAAGSDTIRIALIGCGGRGSGAAVQAMSTKANVRLVAMADAFKDSLEASLSSIKRACAGRVDVPESRQFIGLDSYQKAIDSDANMVLLCSPPGFRPMHFEAAVKAGKHVFMEKPLATDAPGVRRIMAANNDAKKKSLAVAVGHHLRHDAKHREIIGRIDDGAIGKLKYLRSFFNDSGIWVRPRQSGQSEMQYQVRNWYHFTWLSGDHIVEQAVHECDISNWIAKAHPVEAQGMGGRQVCAGRDTGEIYDHHAVEFTYPDGVRAFSYCRQIPGCWISFCQHAHGVNGEAMIEGQGVGSLSVMGQNPMRWRRGPDGHQVEMDDLFAALLAGRSYNEADWAAESTMTAILGRMATYSGKVVKWNEAINSQLDLAPKRLAWDADTLVKPDSHGLYACAIPGATRAW